MLFFVMLFQAGDLVTGGGFLPVKLRGGFCLHFLAHGLDLQFGFMIQLLVKLFRLCLIFCCKSFFLVGSAV